MPDFTPNVPGSAFTIEAATWRDLNALRELEKACFPKDAWPLLDLVSVLAFPNIVRLKAMVDGRFAGFVAGDPKPIERLAWIATLAVFPVFRKQGIGTALLKACEMRLKGPRVRLCVRISNHEAIRLYEHNGYQRIAVWTRYYTDGEDAVVMEKIW